MKTLNILIFTLLGRGHVYPVLPLCRELSKRGHHVTYATSPQYVSDIEHSGAKALIFESSAPGEEFARWWSRLAHLPFDDPSWFSPPDEWICDLRADTSALHREVRRCFESTPPDVVLYDQYFYPGYIVSRRLGCPRVRLSAHFANYKNFLIRRNGVCLNSDAILEYGRRLCRFLLEEGVETDWNVWPLENLNIHFLPGAFQYHCASFDERFCFAGRSIDRHFRRNWVNKDPHSPLVLISGFSGLPGMHEVPGYPECVVEALANSEFHCVLLNEAEESLLRPLPLNFEVCPGASPLEMLPHASLIVCCGGMGSSLEAICSGVPVVSIPASPSADEVAYRVAELGLGVRILREEVTTERIRETVAKMLGDSSLRERVKEVESTFKQAAGMIGAGDRIEHFADTR